MPLTTLSVRMDEDVKRRFDFFCASVGMSATVAVNVFARTVLRENRIPFDILGNDDPFYSEPNQRHLTKVISDIEAGRNLATHELIRVGDDE